MNKVRHAVLTEECLDASITAEITIFPEGIHAAIYGGHLPHIGAISAVDAGGTVRTLQYPGHRDAVISEKWAVSLSNMGFAPVVVTAGIHYDALSKENIESVLMADEKLLMQAIGVLKEAMNGNV